MLGLAVIHSGIDWSGSPDHDSSVFYAMVHIDSDHIPALEAALRVAKARLRVPEGYVFRHVGCSDAAHRAFYDVISDVLFSARLLVVPPIPRSAPIRGHEEIRMAIVRLVLDCPDTVVAKQKLYIDLERRDSKQVRELRTRVRRELGALGRRTFENMQPCPDHRSEGGIVQLADMLAGELREHAGVGGPYLRSISSKLITVV